MPVLEQLHWLPVRQRIVFKVLGFHYKALHDMALEYPACLLHPQTHNPRLRLLHDKLQLAVSIEVYRQTGVWCNWTYYLE